MEEFTIIKRECEIKIDNNKVIIKWKPILDALKIEDEELRFFCAVYFEYFQIIHPADPNKMCGMAGRIAPIILETKRFTLNEKFDLCHELLPINFKLLSILNLKDKHCEIRNGLPKKTISIPISNQTYHDIEKSPQMDALMFMELIILKIFGDKINSELEKNNNFLIDSLIDSVMIKDISSKSEESTENTAVYNISYELVLTTKYQVL